MRRMKSPIKDTRFRHVCTTRLKSIIPVDSIVDAYGIFGGKLELSLAESDRTIKAVCLREMIYRFWYCLQEDAEQIYQIIMSRSFKFHGISDLELLQQNLPTLKDPYYQAAVFFILNRCTNGGSISHGKLGLDNYSALALNYLRNFKKPEKFSLILREDYINYIKTEQAFETNEPVDFILFPHLHFSYNFFDYGKNSGYDTQRYNHGHLRGLLEATQKTILIYRKHPSLISFFKDFNIELIDKNGNSTNSLKHYEEAIVTNF